MELVAGAVVAGYQILEPLGQGGQSEVHKALDLSLKREVALKFLSASCIEDEVARRRFLLEARALSSLGHPGIATVFQIGEVEGRPFIAMEYVEGGTLAAHLRQDDLALHDKLRLMLQVVEAVGYAHGKGILHRDLKPGNIMVTREGRAKLLDFGLAKLTSAALRERMSVAEDVTSAGSVVGTVSYVSPEQARGEALDERSDLFSLGIIFYEMLAGRRPFQGASPVATMLSIIKDPAPALPPELAVPELLARVVATLLEKEPDRRYPVAAALLEDLEQVAAEVGGVRVASSGRLVSGTARTSSQVSVLTGGVGSAPAAWHARRLAVAGAAVLVLAAAAAGWWLTRRPAVASGGTVLVLPFEASGEEDRRNLAGLMTGQLIANLSRAPGLRVVALPEGVPPAALSRQELASRGGVRYVVDGNLFLAGEELAVAVKMVDRRDSSVLWSDTIRGRLADVFLMTGRMATAVAAAAGVVVAADRLAFPGPEAFEAYTRGSLALASYDPAQLGVATEQLDRCIAANPSFLPCYERGVRANLQYRSLGVSYDPAYLDRARHLIEQGLEVQPDSPELAVHLGWYRLFTYDFRGAEEAVSRFRSAGVPPGLDLKLLAWLEFYRGEGEAAVAGIERASTANPLQGADLLNLVVLNAMLGRREAAAAASERFASVYSSALTRAVVAGWTQIARDELRGAAASFREAYGSSRAAIISLAAAEAALAAGDPRQASIDLEPWLQKNPYSLEAHWMACLVSEQLGDEGVTRTAALAGQRWATELGQHYPNSTVRLFALYFRTVAGASPPSVADVQAADVSGQALLTSYLQQVTLARLGVAGAIDRAPLPYSPTFWLNRFAGMEVELLRQRGVS